MSAVSLSSVNKRGFDIASLNGYSSALPTPFLNDRLDERAFSAFCNWQIEQGIAAVIVNGTTGEAPTLSDTEQSRLVRLAVDVAGGRVPVIAGAGSNSTAHAVELASEAEACGADALLLVTPYYNRPSQEGLFRHFRSVHDATGVPILLYDVPSRTGCALAIETIVRLANLPRIAGLKDATGKVDRLPQLRRAVGEEFRLFSGDDATALAFMGMGGDGCISVLSNVVPDLCVRIDSAWRRGERDEAQHGAALLASLVAALFADTNPVPVKFALSLMGHMRADVRLPLCEADDQTRVKVIQALNEIHLIDKPELTRRAGSWPD